MKDGDIYYTASVWTHWKKENPTEDDFADYTTIIDEAEDTNDVSKAIEKYKTDNGMTIDGYDHLFRVTECVVDGELEGGFEILESINYEEALDRKW